MGKVTLYGATKVNILDSLLITILKATVFTSGVMDVFTKDLGRTTKWKVKVYLLGQMGESMSVTM